jgi:ferric-dicitrate binding protein FerR (iron transport regulator)
VDPYRELGVPPGATADELRRAYRERVRRLHPDSRAVADDPAADEELRRVTAAWQAVAAQPEDDAWDEDEPEPEPAPHPRVRSRLGIVITLVVLFLLFIATAYAGSPGDEEPVPGRPRPRSEVSD